VTGARTACGIGALALPPHPHDLRSKPGVRGRKPDAGDVERAVYDGLAWLATSWSPWANPNASDKPIFYLYAVERAMDLVGARRLGDHVWYREMAEQLLPRQRADGAWDSKDGQVGDRNGVVDTAFALLFLRRAATSCGGLCPIVTDPDAPPSDGR
jgi:hypothetical protein